MMVAIRGLDVVSTTTTKFQLNSNFWRDEREKTSTNKSSKKWKQIMWTVMTTLAEKKRDEQWEKYGKL